MAEVLPERFILVLIIINSACKGLPTGSPYGTDSLSCNYETKLTETQMSQVESTLDRIESASDPLSGIPRLQLPMISLEDFQENYILSKYGTMFSSSAPPKEDDEINIPTRSIHRGRRNPPGTSIPQYHHRACPPNGSSYVAPVIGINGTGSPVQIIQLQNMKQWFLEEKCLHDNSPVTDALCLSVNRSTVAVVINLENPDLGIHLEPIIVESCAAFVSL
ncbi:hypothetical protein HOLleu_35067 [Holothuria leucospilota]|uniref:Uncharacterized protein n=1 Tax=Holothuria leucospilota TaxID=206669 RepID=A0A9Q0YSS1_HOLLE|nr:hypothetical protein HOLleu_35067 [Holothuria leucospilota]